jgi:MoxR-like ATPase
MNATWELLPFDQLCRMLARKTGANESTYKAWTRAALYKQLDEYEAQETVVVKNVASLDDTQMAQVNALINEQLRTIRDQDLKKINSEMLMLKSEIITAIANSRRVERETVVLDRFKDVERNLGRQHKDFKTLLSLVSTNQNVFLVGPAGSGKTQAARSCAKALGLKFYFNGAIDNEYKLLGFTDAQGRVVHRPFREAYTNGGVYLFDEVDASLPSAVLAFNAALSNDICDFPDICAERHPDFYCLAAGNTFHGADHQYVGRMKQDAAFLDRFLVLDWTYDTDLERGLAEDLWPANVPRARQWFDMVRKVREDASSKGMQIVISPRATIGGVKLLRTQVSWETAVRVTIRKTMKEADWEKIRDKTMEPRPYIAPTPSASKGILDEEPILTDPAYPATYYTATPSTKPKFVVKSHGVTKKGFYKDLI